MWQDFPLLAYNAIVKENVARSSGVPLVMSKNPVAAMANLQVFMALGAVNCSGQHHDDRSWLLGPLDLHLRMSCKKKNHYTSAHRSLQESEIPRAVCVDLTTINVALVESRLVPSYYSRVGAA